MRSWQEIKLGRYAIKINMKTFNPNTRQEFVNQLQDKFTCKLFHPKFVPLDFHIYLKLNFLEDSDYLPVLLPNELHLAGATERKDEMVFVREIEITMKTL